MQIVNIFYELARTHKNLKGFYYGGQRGAGNSVYPLLWLDDPITGRTFGPNALSWGVNFDVLGIPGTEAEIATVQGEAFTAGLAIIERLKTLPGYTVDAYNFITLREYYDDNAAGVRFTANLVRAIPLNLCVEYFDEGKVFPNLATLPDFNTDNPDGCAVFNKDGVLPDFKI